MTRLVLLLAPAMAAAQTYQIAPREGAKFGLEIYKTGLMSGKKHDIEFTRYAGALQYDAARPEASKIEFTIETASIIVLDQWLKLEDQRKVKAQAVEKEGLDIARFPSMRFVSGAIARSGAGFTVEGGLTIRGVTRPAAVAVTMQPQPDGTIRFNGTAQVKLRDYGIKPPSAALGAVGTRNEMDVKFTLVANPR